MSHHRNSVIETKKNEINLPNICCQVVRNNLDITLDIKNLKSFLRKTVYSQSKVKK